MWKSKGRVKSSVSGQPHHFFTSITHVIFSAFCGKLSDTMDWILSFAVTYIFSYTNTRPQIFSGMKSWRKTCGIQKTVPTLMGHWLSIGLPNSCGTPNFLRHQAHKLLGPSPMQSTGLTLLSDLIIITGSMSNKLFSIEEDKEGGVPTVTPIS